MAIAIVLFPLLAWTQTAAILPNAVTQYFDNNGNPLSSGTVDFYIPNTTTRKTTWQDAAETIPNANPVVLNAAGRAIIYGDGIYRQILKDRNGNTIWDAVTSGFGSGGATLFGDGTAVGTVLPWSGITAPTHYAFAYGQELSRVTYLSLYTAITLNANANCTSGSAVLSGISDTTQIPIGAPVEATCVAAGSTVSSKTSSSVTLNNMASVTVSVTAKFFPYGNGNGTTTFNVPDLRGRALAGRDNMGGTAATRLTSTYFAIPGTGATGGLQSSTLITGNLPAYTPTGTNAITDPGHTHTVTAYNSSSSNTLTAGGNGATSSVLTSSSNTTGITSAFTGVAQGGTSVPFSNVQPTITLNYIIKILPDTNISTLNIVTSIQGMTGDLTCSAPVTCIGQVISAAGAGSGNVVGTSPSVVGNFPKYTNTSGALIADSGFSALSTQFYVNVKGGANCNVTGDGVTDDGPLINACAIANPSKTLFFPCSTYRIGTTATLNSNFMEWNGAGSGCTTIIIDYTITPGILINIASAAINFTRIANMTIDRAYPTSNVTISNASPGVVSWAANGLSANNPIVFAAGFGVLPAQLTAGTKYFVKTVLTPGTFTVSATAGGVVINTSGGSGTVSATVPPDLEAIGIRAIDYNYLTLQNLHIKHQGIGLEATATNVTVAPGSLGLIAEAVLFGSNSNFDFRSSQVSTTTFSNSFFGENGAELWNRTASIGLYSYIDGFNLINTEIVPRSPQASSSPAILFTNMTASPGVYTFNNINNENSSYFIQAIGSIAGTLDAFNFINSRFAPATAILNFDVTSVARTWNFAGGNTLSASITFTAPVALVIGNNITNAITLIGGAGTSASVTGNLVYTGDITVSGAWSNLTVSPNTLRTGVVNDTATGNTQTRLNVLSTGPTALQVKAGGTGITIGTSGGLPYFSSTTTIASSALLTQFGPIYGGGAGASPIAMAAATDGQLIVGQTGAAPLWKTPTGCTLSAAGAFACNAATATIANDNTTNAVMFPVWVTASTGNLPLKVSNSGFSYNPSVSQITLTSGATGSPAYLMSNGTTTVGFNQDFNANIFYNNYSGTYTWRAADVGFATTMTLTNAGVLTVSSTIAGTAFRIGNASSLTLSTGEIGFGKITASGTAPGAAGCKVEWVTGTNANTGKLIAYCGTSTTPVTIVDNVGAGLTFLLNRDIPGMPANDNSPAFLMENVA